MSMELSPPAIGGIRPAAPATEPVKTLGFDPSIPATDNELIMMNNLNPSPSASAVNALENNDSASSSNNSSAQILRARLQLSAICWSLFLAGWNDGTSGPLIPRMQKVYHASFLVVSLVFVVSSLGFIFGAAVNMYWTDKQGFGRLMVFGAACQVAAYSIQAPAPPFPLFAASFFLNGLAISIQNAQANAYVASLRFNSETYLGMLHACYGAGALCSPLVATQFSQIDHWSFHYLASLGMAVFNIIILTLTFRFRLLSECLALIGQAPGDTSINNRSNFRQILSFRSVHVLGFFALMYAGVEVSIGGWITTYLIDVRGAGPSAGYTTSGFFGGIMIGRVALLWLNKKGRIPSETIYWRTTCSLPLRGPRHGSGVRSLVCAFVHRRCCGHLPGRGVPWADVSYHDLENVTSCTKTAAQWIHWLDFGLWSGRNCCSAFCCWRHRIEDRNSHRTAIAHIPDGHVPDFVGIGSQLASKDGLDYF